MTAARDAIAGVVLAGGLSSRMGGGDKTLVSLHGTAMLDRVVARLRPQVGALAINANGDAERFRRYGLPVVADTVAGFAGPLAGILAGLSFAEQAGAGRLAVVAGDTPFFPPDLVARLAEAAGDEGETIAVAASSTGVHPVFSLWPTALRPALEAFLAEDGSRKIMAFADRYLAIPVAFEHLDAGGREVDPFFNVNTPEDAAEAERIAATLDAAAMGRR